MIHSLHLVDFGPFADVVLDFDAPLTLVVGPNGGGKSWLRDALVFALTGTLRTRRGITKKNQIPENAIRDGAKRAQVDLLFQGGLRVIRQVSTSGTQVLELREPGEKATGEERIPGTNEELQAEIYRRLGLDEGRALAALDSGHFLELDPDERKALLFRALGAGVTAETVEKALAARGIEGAAAKTVARLAAAKGFRKAEESAVEARRAAKRGLDAIALPNVVRTVPGKDGKPVDLETLDAAALAVQIEKVGKDRDKLLSQQGATRATARNWVEVGRRRKAEIEGLFVAAKLAPDPDEVRQQLDQEKDLSAGLGRELADVQEKIRKVAPLTRPLDEMANPGQCPAIAGFMCPATKKAIAAHAAQAKDARDAAVLEAGDLASREQQLSADLRAANEKIAPLRAQLTALEKWLEEKPTLVAELEQLTTDLENAEKVADELEAAGKENPGAGQAEELRQKIARGQDLLAKKHAYDQAKSGAAKAAVARESAMAEVAAADRLAQALQPDGVEQDLVKEALPSIRERLAETGKALGRVTLDDDLTVRVEISGKSRHEPQLSGGQRLVLGIVLQDALTMVTRLPALVIDGADTLVQDLRAQTLGMLEGLIGRPYGSILVLAASDKVLPSKPPSERVEMFHLSAPGIVEKL